MNNINHLNSQLIQNSSPYCIWFPGMFGDLTFYLFNTQILKSSDHGLKTKHYQTHLPSCTLLVIASHNLLCVINCSSYVRKAYPVKPTTRGWKTVSGVKFKRILWTARSLSSLQQSPSAWASTKRRSEASFIGVRPKTSQLIIRYGTPLVEWRHLW